MGLVKILFMLSLLTLISCSGGKTSATLEISHSFMSTSPFGGGFMVVGESASGKKFSISLKGTNTGKVLLDADTWSFYAVGWDGSTPNYAFEGNTYCGKNASFALSDTNKTVTIDMNQANCADPAFITATNYKTSLSLLGCDIFYSYNKNTDQYTSLAPEHSTSFCAQTVMPAEYLPKFSHYRVSALNMIAGPDAIGFTSECKVFNNTSIDLKIPTAKFPFKFSLYKTPEDCNSKIAAQTYKFENGLASGSSAFDSVLSPGNQTLLLATSKTKRGRSPFMNEIPRILCGTSGSFVDCFAEPTVASHIQVPFYSSGWNESTIIKNLNPSVTSCPTNLLSSSKMFDYDSCEVDERSVKIRAYRNAFVCQENPSQFYGSGSSIRNFHKKGNFVYALKTVSTVDSIVVYNTSGKQIREYNLGSIFANNIAVSESGNTIVVASGPDINIFTVDGAGSISGPVTYSSQIGQYVEVSPDGSKYYRVDAADVYVHQTSDGSQLGHIDFINAVTSMKMTGSDLYLLEDGIGSNYIYRWDIRTTIPVAMNPGGHIFTAGDDFSKLDVDGSKVITMNSGIYSIYNLDFTTAHILNMDASSVMASPTGMFLSKGSVVLWDSNTVKAVGVETGTLVSDADGSCDETFQISAGGKLYTVDLETFKTPNVTSLFRDLFKLVGMRMFVTDIERPFYYFEEISHDDERTPGGELSDIQEMLSPNALGGFFSESSCAEVKSKLPITKDVVYQDETTGERMNFRLEAVATADPIADYNCDDVIASCPPSDDNKYDIVINFRHLAVDRTEKMKIKLKCGKQIGTFERREGESGELKRELLIYQTEFDVSSRYERYQMNEESMKLRAEVSKFYKNNATEYQGRRLETEYELPTMMKKFSIIELERSGSNILSSRYNIEDHVSTFYTNSSSTTYAGVNFDVLRDIADMSGNVITEVASVCMNASETLVTQTPIAGCTFTDYDDDPKGGPLTRTGANNAPAELDIENPANPLRVVTGGVFEITP